MIKSFNSTNPIDISTVSMQRSLLFARPMAAACVLPVASLRSYAITCEPAIHV